MKKTEDVFIKVSKKTAYILDKVAKSRGMTVYEYLTYKSLESLKLLK